MRAELIPEATRRELWNRAYGKCEARIQGICAYHGTDPHHRKMRSRGGSNDLLNLLLCCRPCHDAITKMAAGTERFRTHSYSPEGVGEDDVAWQP